MNIPFGYLLHLLVQDHQCHLMFSEVFTAEEDDGVGEKESADTTMFDVQDNLGGFFEHVPQIYLFH
jgi:hypothetical protein